MHNEHIKKILKGLPESPGVYKYFDLQQNLIYIGKAKSLKRRVSSYFFKKHHDNKKTAILVSRIVDIQYTLVETEMDALLLENALIKKFQPRFNISLKDDKTYASIAIKNERFPRVVSTRTLIKDGSEYFGPYANGYLKYTLLDLIKAGFPLRNCNYNLSEENISSRKFKACLEYDIGNCMAPCVGKQSEEEYMQSIQAVKKILKGNLFEVRQDLKSHMVNAASELEFEKADAYKKKLELLENYQSKSTIVSEIKHDVDVFSIVSDERFAFSNYLKVSNGIIVQTQTFELKKKLDETDEELLSLAIAEVREKYQSRSTEIIVPIPLDWEDSGLVITVPKLGDKKKLLDLSMKNAQYYKRDKLTQYELLNPELKTDRILSLMKQDLRLTELPKHIECFDNSNLQGTNPVSACVVFRDAKPSKKDYRHFIPKTVEGPDDFATMREVVFRRYRGLLESNEPLPNLIIVDGGKGQLSSAVESLKELGIYGQVPIIGIAKRLEELYYPDDDLPLYIDKKSETLKIIQQLRDEAHRFGITHHRKRRSKNSLVSELDTIKGIGPESAKQLLQELKSVKKIKEAKLETLIDMLGSAKGNLVYTHFHP
ncbi:MAG: excinuclease ABC subunit UvrC [Bacteroidia bacterium]|jgi:excinuclease ABC subunit C|nr:excinuclease ABC subunit UvrC [Bacteroidia bacterium]